MSGDLTRWNRAALSRFRYVDGNAATYLEDLRLALDKRFGQWAVGRPPQPLGGQVEPADPPPNETAAEWLARLLAQYNQPRCDWGWETTRTFARALHILTEHIDAFANEGYLHTATQLSSLHQLAQMIGYTPAAASSAQTPLVLRAKPDVTVATVARGFAVKAMPPGMPPIIFETLADIDIAPMLNAVHLADWNKNATPVASADIGKPGFWQLRDDLKLSVGAHALVAQKIGAALTPLADVKIEVAGDGFSVSVPSVAMPLNLIRDTVYLYVAPAQILVPSINGAGAVLVSPFHGLSAGDVIFWSDMAGSHMASVLAAEDAVIRLAPAGGAGLPVSGKPLYRASLISYAQYVANEMQWRLPEATYSAAVFVSSVDGNGQIAAPIAVTNLAADLAADNLKKVGYYVITSAALAAASQIWLANPGAGPPATSVTGMPLADALEFQGAPTNIASGDPVLLQTSAGGYTPSWILSVQKSAKRFRVEFPAGSTGAAGVTAMLAAFAPPLRPVEAEFNPNPVTGSDLAFDLDPGGWPAPLTSGRTLVLESASDAFDPLPVRIVSIDPPADGNKVHIDQTLPQALTIGGIAPPAGFRLRTGDLVIRANVANAGHGQTKPMRVLGSGDASATGQSFAIDMSDVSHVRDVSFPGGMRADFVIQVGDEFYKQVANLGDSDPADPVFAVSTTEAGTLILTFGDGRHGRRLPTGANNVRATLREGSGPSGNLAAGTLTDIVKKHPAVDSFEQAVAAIGGSNPETLDQIRTNAPGRLAAMDRAISVADYQQLAQRFQGVLHALAHEQFDQGRSREGVAVVIVPAGGGPLGTMADEIKRYLTANGLPSVDLTIVDYIQVPAEILVRARVNSSEYDPRDVATRVRAALLATFDLSLRSPAQPFYRSEVYRVVTGIEGVANCDVTLFKSGDPPNTKIARGEDGSVWTVYPANAQVVYAANPARITVETAEATI